VPLDLIHHDKSKINHYLDACTNLSKSKNRGDKRDIR
jgi:hypothetical protein